MHTDPLLKALKRHHPEMAQTMPKPANPQLEAGETVETAPPVARDVIQVATSTRPGIRLLIAVCAVSGIRRDVLQSPQRGRELVHWRCVYSFIAIKWMGLSYSQSGRDLCRDHSTVMHAVNKVLKDPARYADDIAAVEGRL